MHIDQIRIGALYLAHSFSYRFIAKQIDLVHGYGVIGTIVLGDGKARDWQMYPDENGNVDLRPGWKSWLKRGSTK